MGCHIDHIVAAVAWNFGISERKFGEFGDIHVKFDVCIEPET